MIEKRIIHRFKLWNSLFFICFSAIVSAQDSVLVTKNFKFQDGVYLNFEAFQRNKPSFIWADIETNLATNKATFQTQCEYLRQRATGDSVKMDTVWGIVINGIPYIKLPQSAQKHSASVFSGLILRGRLCYFQYDDIVEEIVPITAYIPETGAPYVTKNIINKKTVVREKLLEFVSGRISDLSLANFKSLIEDDPELVNTLNALSGKELNEKLFKCLLIYNDRHPVYIRP